MLYIDSVMFLLIVIPWCIYAYEYCSYEEELCHKKRHIYCKPEQLENKNFKSYSLYPMTQIIRQVILDKHNEYRNKIACGDIRDKNGTSYPTAARMEELQWDYELEFVSRVHAERCTMEHDECRATKRFPKAGQNLAQTTTSNDDKDDIKVLDTIKMFITMWFDEHKVGLVENVEGIPVSDGAVIGHFTAMVNEQATKIGCSLNKCINGNRMLLFTCNYSYINMRFNPSYYIGKPTSKCRELGKERSEKYKCLCSN